MAAVIMQEIIFILFITKPLSFKWLYSTTLWGGVELVYQEALGDVFVSEDASFDDLVDELLRLGNGVFVRIHYIELGALH